jgi:ABC-type antimicrobial peptide transport system permease subunit
MITIETKSFEMGVMRMVGLKKSHLITGILIQSFLFVGPAILLGFLTSLPILKTVHYVFLVTMDLRIDILPNRYTLG